MTSSHLFFSVIVCMNCKCSHLFYEIAIFQGNGCVFLWLFFQIFKIGSLFSKYPYFTLLEELGILVIENSHLMLWTHYNGFRRIPMEMVQKEQ